MRLGGVSKRRVWLVAYDISDDKTRRRVAVALGAVGWRVQRSVFVVELRADGVRALVARVAEMVEPQTDRVDFVPLPVSSLEGWRSVGGVPPSWARWVCV